MATTYYIRKTGSDANAGTSAGAAWLTIQKAHNAGAGPTGGDTVYVGPGTYREVVTASLTSPTSELQFIADVDGSHTGDAAGPVIWTAYLTNDVSAPSATSLLTLSAKDFLTYQGFYLQGGSGNPTCVDASTNNSQNITFRQCVFGIGAMSVNTIRYIGTAGEAANWLIDRCVGAPAHGGTFVSATSPTVTGSDYDVNFVIRNSLFGDQSNVLLIGASGALAQKAGGYVIQNCTQLGGTTCIQINSANLSTSVPSLVKNCLMEALGSALIANVSGQIVENYNIIHASTARTNVSAGANSISTYSYAVQLDLGYSLLNGFGFRGLAELTAASAALGFGNDSTPAALATDIFGRPRPAGGGSTSLALGAFERHDTATKETSVTDAGSVGLKITGPGDHDFKVPVNAVATVLSVRVRYDTNHGTGNKPQAILLANGEITVSTETKTATVGVDTWETLTFSSFTASAKGIVIVRLVSRAAAGSGIAYFDTMVAPDIDLGDFGHFSRSEPTPLVSGTGSGIKRQLALTGGLGG